MHQSCKVTMPFCFIIFLLTLTFALSSLTCKHSPTKQGNPYTFSVFSGDLPPGLTLGSDGAISGTPTTEGTYTFSIKITDSSNPAYEATKEFILTVKKDVFNLDLKVNYSDGPIKMNQSDTITLTVTLNNKGRTDEADWWIAADTPSDLFFFTFDDWTTDWVPAYQGPLFYLDSYEVLTMAVSELQSGTYIFYFGIDTYMDGNVTWDNLYCDSVVANVTK